MSKLQIFEGSPLEIINLHTPLKQYLYATTNRASIFHISKEAQQLNSGSNIYLWYWENFYLTLKGVGAASKLLELKFMPTCFKEILLSHMNVNFFGYLPPDLRKEAEELQHSSTVFLDKTRLAPNNLLFEVSSDIDKYPLLHYPNLHGRQLNGANLYYSPEFTIFILDWDKFRLLNKTEKNNFIQNFGLLPQKIQDAIIPDAKKHGYIDLLISPAALNL